MYDPIFELVKDYGLKHKVIFTGYVKEEDIVPLLCGARIFIFPSLYEGFGIPPLEAMACGIPVVASNVSSLPEVVGKAGLLVSPKDIEGIENAMRRLLEDQEFWKTCRDAGFEQA